LRSHGQVGEGVANEVDTFCVHDVSCVFVGSNPTFSHGTRNVPLGFATGTKGLAARWVRLRFYGANDIFSIAICALNVSAIARFGDQFEDGKTPCVATHQVMAR
jgi:hypothetical protein